MSRFLVRSVLANVVVVALLAATSVFAADAATEAMQAAYAPYRAALFKTNGTSKAESEQAMQQARQAWARVVADYAARPPAPYDRDTAFATSLAEVSTVYARASEQIASDQLGAAHETLEQVRDILSDLRRRNNVVVFSDQMNAYHAEMERVLADGAALLAQPGGNARLAAVSGALAYLAARLASEAPQTYARNEEFVALVGAVQKSVADLQQALFNDDRPAAQEALRKLKPPYAKLFLKFG